MKLIQFEGFSHTHTHTGFTCSLDGKESVWNAGNLGSIPGWEDPLEMGTAILPGEFHGLYSPWGRKVSDRTEQLPLSQK